MKKLGILVLMALLAISMVAAAPTCTWGTGIASNGEYLPTATWSITGTEIDSGTITFGGNAAKTLTVASTTAASFKGDIPDGIYTITASVLNASGTSTACTTLTGVVIATEDEASHITTILASQPEKKTGVGDSGIDPIILIGAAAVVVMLMKKD